MKNDPKDAYRALLLDPRWRIRRQQVLEAKGRKCEGCGSVSRLEVHHGFYVSGRMPWDYPDSALHVLCHDCHKDEHQEPVQQGEFPSTAPLVRSLASDMVMPKKPWDPRKALWEIAQSRSNSKATATALMAVLAWVWFTRGIHDLAIVNQVASKIGGMSNPYAYLQPGGKALEALIGTAAVDRAETERAENNEADRQAGLGRRS